LKYCRYCGQQVNDHADFCPHCGKKLTVEPAVTYLSQVRRSRRWSGPKILAITLLFGVVAIFVAALLEEPTVFEPLGVGIIEEFAKLLGPFLIAFLAPYYLRTKNGTVSLAVASALTFTIIEDLLYLSYYGEAVFGARLLTFPLHFLWTGLAAFGVSLAVMRVRNEPLLQRKFLRAYFSEGPLALLAIAILLHAGWDYSPVNSNISILVSTLIILYAMSVYFFLKAYKHFPNDMTTYQFHSAKAMLKDIISL
jgi:RsiW-degrading membrane proteinase PrsW (M82 family)